MPLFFRAGVGPVRFSHRVGHSRRRRTSLIGGLLMVVWHMLRAMCLVSWALMLFTWKAGVWCVRKTAGMFR